MTTKIKSSISNEVSKKNRTVSQRRKTNQKEQKIMQTERAYSSVTSQPQHFRPVSYDHKTVSSFGHVCGKKSKSSIEEELFYQVYQSLMSHNLKSQALLITQDLIGRLFHVWGGCQMYFPKPDVLELQYRHDQIFQEFSGKNHKALAEKYGYSLPTIYRIIAAVSKKQRCHCLRKMLEESEGESFSGLFNILGS